MHGADLPPPAQLEGIDVLAESAPTSATAEGSGQQPARLATAADAVQLADNYVLLETAGSALRTLLADFPPGVMAFVDSALQTLQEDAAAYAEQLADWQAAAAQPLSPPARSVAAPVRSFCSTMASHLDEATRAAQLAAQAVRTAVLNGRRAVDDTSAPGVVAGDDSKDSLDELTSAAAAAAAAAEAVAEADDGVPLATHHRRLLRAVAGLRLQRFTTAVQQALQLLRAAPDDAAWAGARFAAQLRLAELSALAVPLADVSWSLLRQLVHTGRGVGKLGYVVHRTVLTLLRKGFCTPPDEEDDDDDGPSDMTFEDDVEGTGLGEGQGKQDVSEELDEEQLLDGRKEEADDGDAGEPPPDIPDDDEGVEMDQDFDGKEYDMPRDGGDDDDDDEDDGEELDREMGDVDDSNEVVDERLWGSEDEEDDVPEDGDDKFEKDAPLAGPDDGIRGKEEGEDDDSGDKEEKKGEDKEEEELSSAARQALEKEEEEQGSDGEEDGRVHEEEVEERHLDVDIEKPEGADDEEEAMELPDDMNLDGGESGDEEEEEAGEGPDDPLDREAEGQFEDEGEDGEGDGDGDDEGGKDEEDEEAGPEAMDIEAGGGGGDGDDDDDEEKEEGADPEQQGDTASGGGGGGDDEGGEEEEEGKEEEKEQEEGDDGDKDDDADEKDGEEAGEKKEGELAEETAEDEAAAAAMGAEAEEMDVEQNSKPAGAADALGVSSHDRSGQDSVAPDGKDEDGEEDGSGGEEEEEEGAAPAPVMDDSAADATPQTGGEKEGSLREGNGGEAPPPPGSERPPETNPWRSLGDMLQQWHKRLDMVSDAGDKEMAEHDEDGDDGDDGGKEEGEEDAEETAGGRWEHVRDDERSAAQVLDAADESQVEAMPEADDEDEEDAGAGEDGKGEELVPMELEDDAAGEDAEEQEEDATDSSASKRSRGRGGVMQDLAREEKEEEAGEEGDVGADEEGDEREELPEEGSVEEEDADDSLLAPVVHSSSFGRRGRGDSGPDGVLAEDELERLRAVLEEQLRSWRGPDAVRGRDMWASLSAMTQDASNRLCEQLRLILEPMLASRLAGDYRTGKRINMRRIIPYIASQFRKDKIWLRRTKPEKRQYQILLAIDDSESMKDSGAGVLALEALTLLTKAMTQLEVGDIGVVRFGEEVKLLHDVGAPFTDDSGGRIVSQFEFGQRSTNLVRTLETLVRVLQDSAPRLSVGSRVECYQIMFILTDGRIEQERSLVKHWVREAASRRQLVVLLVLDDGSIFKTEQLRYVLARRPKGVSKKKRRKAELQLRPYLEDYPFPYYIVLGDIKRLPETLGDTLRQWFEMLQRDSR
eukprot:PLAT3542.5.p1 GENE.PLAT3542.5~~PLAT3542.5.p1  ORF type:complete len:1352 (+),score=802.56 PLAT3542.5:74-4057(+)